MAVYEQKEETPRSEQTAAAQLLEKLPPLDGKIITADALPFQRHHAQTIVEKGGDYLFQAKGNQPTLHQQAQSLDALKDTPFLPTTIPVTGGPKPDSSMTSPSNRSPQASPLPEP